jgi:hypothetical protein
MLREDIKILPLIEQWRSENSLAINSGVKVIEPGCYLEGIKSPDKFHCGIYRPHSDWRRLTAAELGQVLGVTAGADIANTVCLIETPRTFLSEFYKLGLDQMSRSPAHWEEKMNSSFPSFAGEFKDWLEQEIFDEFRMCSAFVSFTRPCSETTTFDLSQNRYRGMHIDNWGAPPRDAGERDACGIRICINLGFEKRDVVFINLRLISFLNLLASKRGTAELSGSYKETYAQPFAEDFLNECSDYPVLKVSLNPCQAYIGPVQNMIHDGYALLKRYGDVNLQLSADEFRYRNDFLSRALSAGAKAT